MTDKSRTVVKLQVVAGWANWLGHIPLLATEFMGRYVSGKAFDFLSGF